MHALETYMIVSCVAVWGPSHKKWILCCAPSARETVTNFPLKNDTKSAPNVGQQTFSTVEFREKSAARTEEDTSLLDLRWELHSLGEPRITSWRLHWWRSKPWDMSSSRRSLPRTVYDTRAKFSLQTWSAVLVTLQRVSIETGGCLHLLPRGTKAGWPSRSPRHDC